MRVQAHESVRRPCVSRTRPSVGGGRHRRLRVIREERPDHLLVLLLQPPTSAVEQEPPPGPPPSPPSPDRAPPGGPPARTRHLASGFRRIPPIPVHGASTRTLSNRPAEGGSSARARSWRAVPIPCAPVLVTTSRSIRSRRAETSAARIDAFPPAKGKGSGRLASPPRP